MKKFTRTKQTDIIEVGGAFKRPVVVKRFISDDGMNHEFTTFFSDSAQSVAVFGMTPDGNIITTYQFRAGPEKWLYELPGGEVEDAESIEHAARRELLEEAGYEADDLTYLGIGYDDGYVNVKQHVFYASHCSQSQSSSNDEHEKAQGLQIRLLSVDELTDKIAAGKTCYNSKLMMGYWYHLKQKGGAL